jgi:N6-L-threonylcarbamoyladenine synthase
MLAPMIHPCQSDASTPQTCLQKPLLGIESSCDETAAAVLAPDGRVLSNVIASQTIVHEKFGGVVPELAARAHISKIHVVVMEALNEAHLSVHDLGAIAVTTGPGLAGALLVGVNYAKALSYGLGIPLIGVNHLEGHIASAWLGDPSFPLPCVVLVVSGGHTHLYRKGQTGACLLLGCTRDDAAGEAFDKGAHAIPFPRFHQRKSSLEFSFSGLKTSLLYTLRKMDDETRGKKLPDLAAGYQEAIVQVLVAKAFAALAHTGLSALAVVGGVSANSRLRTLLAERVEREGVRLALPPSVYCTDNAAMIALAGRHRMMTSPQVDWLVDIQPSLQQGFGHPPVPNKEIAHS